MLVFNETLRQVGLGQQDPDGEGRGWPLCLGSTARVVPADEMGGTAFGRMDGGVEVAGNGSAGARRVSPPQRSPSLLLPRSQRKDAKRATHATLLNVVEDERDDPHALDQYEVFATGVNRALQQSKGVGTSGSQLETAWRFVNTGTVSQARIRAHESHHYQVLKITDYDCRLGLGPERGHHHAKKQSSGQDAVPHF